MRYENKWYKELERGLREQQLARFRNDLAKNPHEQFCLALTAQRRKYGLTQKELAAMTSTSQNVIANAESTNGNPTLKTLIKIAKALNVRLTLVE